MRAPAELGRLQALRHEAVHRPGVDEGAHGLFGLGALRVALGDVDALHADFLRQTRPVLAVLRLVVGHAQIARDIHQRLLDEPGHHARIGAAARHGRGAARIALARRHGDLAQREVRARFRALALVEIEAGPGLVDGVDVEAVERAAQLHDVDGARVHREVDAEALPAAGGQKRREQLAVIVLRHRLLDEADAALVEELLVLLLRVDDHEAALVVIEMAFDERQGSLTDRAEADHDDGAGDATVDGPSGHRICLLDESSDGER